MRSRHHLVVIQSVAAAALPVLFFVLSVLPAAAGDAFPGAPNPPNTVILTQTCRATDGATYTPVGSYPPGTRLTCLIFVFSEIERRDLSFVETVSGGGRWPDTVTGLGVPAINQHNRQQYGPGLDRGLGPGTSATFSFTIDLPSNLGCYRAMVSEIQMNQAGVQGHLATARATFSVNCNARPVTPP
jgi:hypothetical protein